MDYEGKYTITETMLVFSARRCQYENYISTRFTALTPITYVLAPFLLTSAQLKQTCTAPVATFTEFRACIQATM
jgi:hypothetical protein